MGAESPPKVSYRSQLLTAHQPNPPDAELVRMASDFSKLFKKTIKRYAQQLEKYISQKYSAKPVGMATIREIQDDLREIDLRLCGRIAFRFSLQENEFKDTGKIQIEYFTIVI